MSAPNVEERLTAAAFTILTDGQHHSRDADRWAARFLRQAARGRSTAFQRSQSANARKRGYARANDFRGLCGAEVAS